jgi:hypothetical protein
VVFATNVEFFRNLAEGILTPLYFVIEVISHLVVLLPVKVSPAAT